MRDNGENTQISIISAQYIWIHHRLRRMNHGRKARGHSAAWALRTVDYGMRSTPPSNLTSMTRRCSRVMA
jgi:hypothetical protein